MKTDTTTATDSVAFEKLASANFVTMQHSLAFDVAPRDGLRRLAAFVQSATTHGLRIHDVKRRGGGRSLSPLDELDPEALREAAGARFTLTDPDSRSVIATAVVGSIQSPGPEPEPLDEFATARDRLQREKVRETWARRQAVYRELQQQPFSLILLSQNALPRECHQGSATALVLTSREEMPEPRPLPEGGQELLDSLTAEFLRGEVRPFDQVERERQHLARLARREANRKAG